MRILVVEDEVRLAALLRHGLAEEGHAVDVVGSGEDALDWIDAAVYDVLVLDIMLPGIDGLDVCRALRRRGILTPILLLTARDAVADRVAGLDAGGDDYLVKPFAFAELAARLRALWCRPFTAVGSVLTGGDLRLDPASRRVWRGDDEIVLPNKEFRILECLMRAPGRVLTRAMSKLDPGVVERKQYAPCVGFVHSELVKGGKETAELIDVRPAPGNCGSAVAAPHEADAFESARE
jgi:two-component system OmpR family response regulator